MAPRKSNKYSQSSTAALPPSVEKAYYRKCIDLRRRINEIEEHNDATRLRIKRLNRSVLKMRLERAFLLEQLQQRMDYNVDGSDESTSPPRTVRPVNTLPRANDDISVSFDLLLHFVTAADNCHYSRKRNHSGRRGVIAKQLRLAAHPPVASMGHRLLHLPRIHTRPLDNSPPHRNAPPPKFHTITPPVRPAAHSLPAAQTNLSSPMARRVDAARIPHNHPTAHPLPTHMPPLLATASNVEVRPPRKRMAVSTDARTHRARQASPSEPARAPRPTQTARDASRQIRTWPIPASLPHRAKGVAWLLASRRSIVDPGRIAGSFRAGGSSSVYAYTISEFGGLRWIATRAMAFLLEKGQRPGRCFGIPTMNTRVL